MSGVYFHIPFCRQKCHYCDFYSIRDSNGADDLIQSEINELLLRKNYLDNEVVKTLYFGGGTPSLLTFNHLNDLLGVVRDNFDVSDDCEITLEANPDDLSEQYLRELYQVGINRLSIGIQSFNDEILKFLGRRHDSKRLAEIVKIAQQVGFNNISGDLIFAIPGMVPAVYEDSLEKIIKLDIQHVSAYALSIEKGTYFNKLLNNNKIEEVGEDEMLRQFNATIDILSQYGYDHYEISSYAKEGYKSRHNCNYWENEKYLGIGPSAHSYNGISRQWNLSDTRKYSSHISQSESSFEIEYLTPGDKYNEYIITGLRTSQGVSERYICENFEENMVRYFSNEVNQLLETDLLIRTGDRVILTRKGMLISDFILRKLYYL